MALGDPGLWLVPNIARRRDAVTGRASAGLVDQLTRGVVTTDAMRERLTDLLDADRGSRLRAIVGPPGCGKSTLMSLLIRPGLVDTLDVTADYVAAAVFLDSTSTLESLTAEWVNQLVVRIPGCFSDARNAVDAELTDEERLTATSFDREIIRPLQRCHPAGRRVRLLIDGLDQPDEGGRDQILAAIATFTHCTDRLGHVRVIAGVRSGTEVETRPELDHAHRIELSHPSPEDLRQVLPPVWKLTLVDQSPSGGSVIGTRRPGIDEAADTSRSGFP